MHNNLKSDKQAFHQADHSDYSSISKFISLNKKSPVKSKYNQSLNMPFKTKGSQICLVGILFIIAEYVNAIYLYIKASNGSDTTLEVITLVVRITIFTFVFILFMLWIYMIKKQLDKWSYILEYLMVFCLMSVYIYGAHIRILSEFKSDKFDFQIILLGLEYGWRFIIIIMILRTLILKLLFTTCVMLFFLIYGAFLTNDVLFVVIRSIIIILHLGLIINFYERLKFETFLKNYELEQNDEVFRMIMNNIPDSILIIGADGKIKYTNKHLKEYFEMSDEMTLSLDKFYNLKTINDKNQDPSINKNDGADVLQRKDVLVQEKLQLLEHHSQSSLSNRHFFNNTQTKNIENSPNVIQNNTNNHDTMNYEPLIGYPNLHELVKYLLYDQAIWINSLKSYCIQASYDEKQTNKIKSFEIKIKPSFVANNRCLTIILRDITDRDIIAFLESRNRYKNNLLASFSHELRTPLNSQINYLEGAISDHLITNEAKNEYLIPALRSCHILKHLINDILDLSLITTGNLMLNIKGYSLVKTLKSCLELFELQAKKKNIKLNLNLKGLSINEVYTDHEKLSQIIVNILGNALKFTQENGTITLKAKNHVSLVKITIQDTGIGMTQEEKARLEHHLNEHYKVKRVSNKAGGIGLGLYICHLLAKMLSPKGVDIGLIFDSKAKNGSWFSFLVENKECVLSNTNTESCKVQKVIKPLNKLGLKKVFKSKNVLEEDYDMIQNDVTWRDIDCDSSDNDKEEEVEVVEIIEERMEGIVGEMNFGELNIQIIKEQIPKFIDEIQQKIQKGKETTRMHSPSDFPVSGVIEDDIGTIKEIKYKKEHWRNSNNKYTNLSMKYSQPNSSNSKSASALGCMCPEILIVDDDSFNIMSMECLLSKLGYTYCSTFDGHLALDMVAKRENKPCCESCKQFKLILMDCNMPIMDGIQTTRILKEKMKLKLLRPIVIIGCTAYVGNEKMNECMEAGMDDFLSKPTDLNRLKNKLNLYMRKHTEETEILMNN